MERCAHQIIEDEARRSPDRAALLYRGTSTSYADLNSLSDQFAGLLLGQGVKPQTFIGICIENSSKAIIALLGILKAGAAFVPFDPRDIYTQRLTDLVADARPSLIVTERDLAVVFEGHSSVINLDTIPEPIAAFDQINNPDSPWGTGTLDNLACILYTSGSTGKPKGVMRTHRAIVHRLEWMDFRPNDVFCHYMALSNGFSQERLFLPLMKGLPLLILENRHVRDIRYFIDALSINRVTNLTVTPAILRQILDVRSVDLTSLLPHLHTVASGGASISLDLIKSFYERLPHSALVNSYGSTESGTVIRGVLTPRSDHVTLGTPLPNTKVYLFGADMCSVEQGSVGELHIGAPCIARGYFGQPILTAERFVSNPIDGTRLFCTGDLARQLSDGRIEFLGRMDRQVKIRNFRVELTEIENAIREYSPVENAVVIDEQVQHDARLVACIVWKDSSKVMLPSLQRHIRQRLPSSMCPTRFVNLAALPLTTNGKIDYAALRLQIDGHVQREAPPPSPMTDTQLKIATIWGEILHLDSVSIDESFFEVGGDSLLSVHMLFELETVFGKAISQEQILTTPTIRGLAAMITSDELPRSLEAIPLQDRENCFRPGLMEEYLLLNQLEREIRLHSREGTPTGFGLSISGPLDCSCLELALDMIIRRHEILRTRFVPIISIGQVQVSGWSEVRNLLGRARLQYKCHFQATIQAESRLTLSVTDLRNICDADQEIALGDLIRQLILSPYDYDSPPLLRTTLVQLNEDEHILIVAASHLICDGWSFSVLQKEIVRFYDESISDSGSAAPVLRVQYLDYAYWQRSRIQNDLPELAVSWTESHRHFAPLFALDLPIAQHTLHPTYEGKVVCREINPTIARSIYSHNKETKSTMFLTMLSAVGLLLHLLTERDHVTLGSYFANRVHPDTGSLIGNLAAYQVLGVRVSPNSPMSEFTAHVKDVVAKAAREQVIPLPLLGHLLATEGFISHHSRQLVDSYLINPMVTCEVRQEESIMSITGTSFSAFGVLERLKRFPQPLRLISVEARKNSSIKLVAAYHAGTFKDADILDILLQLETTLYRIAESSDETLVKNVAGKIN